MSGFRLVAWLLMPLLVVSGCETNRDTEHIESGVELVFAPTTLRQSINVNRIVITIESQSGDALMEEYMVESGKRQMDVSLSIPLDAIALKVEAYEMGINGQEQVTFRGETPLQDVADDTSVLRVLLEPTTAHLKLNPTQQEVPMGQSVVVEILAVEVDNLFAVAVELEFENEKLEPVEVSEGDIFGAEPILFDDIALERSEDRLGIAVAHKVVTQASAVRAS